MNHLFYVSSYFFIAFNAKRIVDIDQAWDWHENEFNYPFLFVNYGRLPH